VLPSLACVSHETTYQFIYGREGRKAGLYCYLPRAFVKRRRRGRRKPRELRGIPDHRHISQRLGEIEHWQTFGHWEGDLVMFRRECGQANLTSLVEQKSRFLLVRKNQSRTSAHVLSDAGSSGGISSTADRSSSDKQRVDRAKWPRPGAISSLTDRRAQRHPEATGRIRSPWSRPAHPESTSAVHRAHRAIVQS
jgi:hypothetical protein